ncbi:MAG TPA: ABC transporter permease [Puia sp.]|nr:ABC transporter permease [Puia sp.]
MVKSYFKTAQRNLVNNKVHSLINISGLSVGLACSLLIFLWVQNESGIDGSFKNDTRLYKVYEREYYQDHINGNYDTPGPLAEELKKEIPEVQDAVMLQEENDQTALQSGDKTLKVEGTGASPGLFGMFGYPLLQGTPASAIGSNVSVAISEKTADAFFGNPQNAMGKTIRFNNKKDFKVSAVFKDLPANVSRKFDYVISWEALGQDQHWLKTWSNSGPLTYVLLREHTDPTLVDKKLTYFRSSYIHDSSAAYHVELGLQKFDQVYLHNQFQNGKVSGGRIEYVRLFSIIAVFILLIACINFMNLTTARSVKRAKEVGVRKVLGAVRSVLIKQFISESLVLTALAVVIALVLMILLLPVFNGITQKQISLPFNQPSFWGNIFILTMTTGLISGSYPALYLSAFNPVKVLKRVTKLGAGAVWFRKGLVVFQFVLSLILIFGTIVVSKQILFIQNRNLGYDKENLVYIPVEGELVSRYSTFKNEAIQLPGIQSVSFISDNPVNLDQGTIGVDWEGRHPNTSILFEHPDAGYDFVNTMKLQVAEGHYFSRDFPTDKDGYVLNQTAVKNMGFTNPVGKMITVNGRRGEVIGVLKDFNFRSLREPIKPMIIQFGETEDFGNILLRTEPGKTKQALDNLAMLCKQFNPAFPFTYSFTDEAYHKLYNNEQIVGKLSNVFASLAIFISCLGLLGLIIFTAEQRTKEIGIRKVLGASVGSIMQLLSADFLKLVLIAILLASPIAWLAMNDWLKGYAYKINISFWMFAVAGGLVVLIAVFTISFQAIKAAMANPVKSLRTE